MKIMYAEKKQTNVKTPPHEFQPTGNQSTSRKPALRFGLHKPTSSKPLFTKPPSVKGANGKTGGERPVLFFLFKMEEKDGRE